MNSQSVNSLFGNAASDGAIGAGAVAVLTAPDLGAQIQAGLGVSVDDVSASEVVLVTLLVDDSGSIDASGNEQTVRDGCNLVMQALASSKQNDGILVSIRYLNGTVLTPFVPLDQAPVLDSQNYRATGGTPLYDQSVVALGGVIAKTQEFLDSGVGCRSVSLIVSDGADMHSRRNKAADVAKVVRDMRLTESHIVAAMGIDDGCTDFRKVFGDMGVDAKWILTPGDSPAEIRKAFQVFSQSAVSASQSAGSFSQAAGSGFTS